MTSTDEPLVPPAGWDALDTLGRAAAAERLQRAWWDRRDLLLVEARREGRTLREIADAVGLHVNTVARAVRACEGKPAWKRSDGKCTVEVHDAPSGCTNAAESTPHVPQPVLTVVERVDAPDDPAARARAFAQMVRR